MTGNGQQPTEQAQPAQQPPTQTNSTIQIPEMAAAAVKLPNFWMMCPQAWFISVESQFSTKNITADNTKYEYVISALPQESVIKVLDILQNPPITRKYETLKKVLIERYSDSEESRLEQLLSTAELGDRKPSEFFRSLELLAGTSTTVGAELLKKLWMRKLPPYINVALVAAENRDIQQLVNLADKIFDVSPQHNNFNSINSIKTEPISHSPNISNQNINDLTNLIKSLQIEIAEIKTNMNNRPRSRSRNNSSFRNRSHSRNNNRNPNYCWYHDKFGNNATKCVQPCIFKNSNESSTSGATN